MNQEILIVDDEADIRTLIQGVLEDEGYQTQSVGTDVAAIQAIREKLPHLVILDIWLQGSKLDGIQVLEQVKKEFPYIPVVMISGHGNIETAVRATRIGAYDFIEKPFKADRLLLVAKKAIEEARLRRENEELKQRYLKDVDLNGKSQPILTIKQTIERVAPTNSRILITGSAGSGKEVASRLVHKLSKRVDGPFVVVNCATMRPDRFESELFGTEVRKENDATVKPRKVGFLEQAHGGTLVLDEISDMPLETQGKIVRVLQDQTFQRVGGNTPIKVDVRIIATSNRDLNEQMKNGRFRQDLYYRLNVVPIIMPSLAERREDIPELAKIFMERASDSSGIPSRRLGEDALAALQAYDWPGNVRQLRNVIEWLLIMSSGAASSSEPIGADLLPPDISSATPDIMRSERSAEIMTLPLRDAREVFEREYLLAQVTRFGGNISRTAAFIGMERSALHRKLKSLGVTTASANDPGEPPVAAAAPTQAKAS
jgi:two-component system nitrogen regulation response regulator NtrX